MPEKMDDKKAKTLTDVGYIKAISPDKYFYVHDGQIIKNPGELPAALKKMSDSTFRYHVNDERNDFASWINGVFHDNERADAVASASTRELLIGLFNAGFRQSEVKRVSYLRDISPQKYFYAHDGRVIKNPLELVDALEEMDDKTFEFHASSGKNDFYSWIKEVFHDSEKADMVKSCQTKEEMAYRLKKSFSDEGNDAPAAESSPVRLDLDRIEKVRKGIGLELVEKMDFGKIDNPENLRKSYESAHSDLCRKVSEMRKKGFDTKMAELWLLRIPPRIKIFAATETQKDADAAERALEEARLEINETVERKEAEHEDVAPDEDDGEE